MSDITISYKGNSIATMDATGTKTLLTEGKYCEDDIEVAYTKPSGGSVSITDTTDTAGGTIRTITATGATVPTPSSAIAKIILNGTTQIDLTQDTVAASNLISPNTAHGADGQGVVGGVVGAITYEDLASSAKPSGDVVLTGTRIENYAFAYRSNCPSWTVHAPNCTYVGTNAFRQCNTLTELHLPKLETMHNTGYVVQSCGALTLVDWGTCDVRGNTFTSCSVLSTMILRKTTIQPLNDANGLKNTPFWTGGTGGTIYIPKVLYDHLGDGTSLDYKAASNWSTYDGYGTITWAKIEGSIYELSA